MKILKGVLVVVCVVSACFLLTGLLAPVEFSGVVSDTYNAPPLALWTVLTDLEHMPERRKEISKIEMLGLTGNGNPRWKEYAGDKYMIFEMTEQDYGRTMTVQMTESTVGMTGTWTYELQSTDSANTKFIVTEKSQTKGLFMRGLMTLVGRGHIIKRELTYMHDALNGKKP